MAEHRHDSRCPCPPTKARTLGLFAGQCKGPRGTQGRESCICSCSSAFGSSRRDERMTGTRGFPGCTDVSTPFRPAPHLSSLFRASLAYPGDRNRTHRALAGSGHKGREAVNGPSQCQPSAGRWAGAQAVSNRQHAGHAGPEEHLNEVWGSHDVHAARTHTLPTRTSHTYHTLASALAYLGPHSWVRHELLAFARVTSLPGTVCKQKLCQVGNPAHLRSWIARNMTSDHQLIWPRAQDAVRGPTEAPPSEMRTS